MSEYTNELDQWYNSCPGPVQSVLSWPYSKISEILQWVTGDPNKVAGEGPTYIAQGRLISAYAQEIDGIKAGLGEWTGEARNTFNAKMDTLGGNFTKLGDAVAKTDEILKAAAETSVDAANFIIDAVKMLVELLIAQLAINAALAVFTFGASMAAFVAEAIADIAATSAEILQGMAKVAQILAKIAEVMARIAELLRKLAEILKVIKELLAALKELKGTVGILGKGMILAVSAAVKAPINAAANAGIDGLSDVTGTDLPNMPGGVSEGYHAGRDAADAVGDSNRATETAANNRPPGG